MVMILITIINRTENELHAHIICLCVFFIYIWCVLSVNFALILMSKLANIN